MRLDRLETGAARESRASPDLREQRGRPETSAHRVSRVFPEQLEQPAAVGLRVRLVRRDKLEIRVRRAAQDPRELPANLEQLEIKEASVRPVLLDPLDLLGPLDLTERRDLLDRREIRVSQDPLDKLAQLVYKEVLVERVQPDTLVRLEPPVRLALLDKPDSLELPDQAAKWVQRETQDRRVKSEHRDRLDSLEQLERPETRDHWDRLAAQGREVSREPLETRDRRGLMVSLVVPANQDLRELRVILETRELLDHLELLVYRVPVDRMVNRVTRELPVYVVRQAPRVRLGPRDQSVSRDSRDLRVMPDRLAQLVKQVQWVNRGMSELLERQARLEPLDLRARQELRASREPVVNREQMELLVHQVLMAHKDQEDIED